MSQDLLPFAEAVDRLSEERTKFLAEVKKASDEGKIDQFPVYADEEFGSMMYCEQKAVFEYESDEEKADSVEQAAEVNQAAADTLPASRIPQDVNDELLKEEGHGVYTNYHPTLERNGLWIRCFPDLFVFGHRRPQFSVRLRGTSQRYLHSSFENRELPSWLTCRVMDQLGFDTSDMYYVIIRYDTDYYYHEGSDDETEDRISAAQILGALEMKFANAEYNQIRNALSEFDHIDVDVHDYTREKFADAIYRYIQIWKGKAEPQGADIEGKCRNCKYRDRCAVSLI